MMVLTGAAKHVVLAFLIAYRADRPRVLSAAAKAMTFNPLGHLVVTDWLHHCLWHYCASSKCALCVNARSVRGDTIARRQR